MKIEIVVKETPAEGPEAPVTYALVLELASEFGVTHNVEWVLQKGYSSPQHALGALIECLTFAPPDLSTYEEGLANLAGIMDRTRDLEEAMTAVGGRLNEAEEKLEGLAGPMPAAPSRLLPPRPGGPALPRAAAAPVAPIRQAKPATRNIISAGHGAGGRVNGGAPLAITGGVGARGNLGPTGPGADEGLDGDGEIS